MEFNYEKLDVSKGAKKVIVRVYKMTNKFPDSEVYGLTSQLRRAVVSVLLNIAEGSSRQTKKDFKRFVRISIGSLVEVDAALKIAIDLEYITNGDYLEIEPLIREVYFKLIGLSKYLS
mgnify:CR=1 FL=1